MKKVVFTFGRMNPPTVGHQKLVDKVQAVAKQQSADARVYLSHTQNNKKDPLDYKTKIRYAQKAFGSIVTNSTAKTIILVLKELQSAGYTDVTLVVGSDRVSDFKQLLTKYNGKDYQFNSIKVQSAGERDPDAEGVSGMSASKMRALAIEGDFKSFKSGLPKGLQSIAQPIYDKLRSVMEEVDQLDEFRVLSLSQRLKRGRMMKRIAKKVARMRAIKARRMADNAKLTVRSRKKAISMLRKRVAGQQGKDYAQLSAGQKMTIDRLVQKKSAIIDKLAKRLMPKVRKAEVERLKRVRSQKHEEYTPEHLSEANYMGPNERRVRDEIKQEKQNDKVKYDGMRDRARIKDVLLKNRGVTAEEVKQDQDIKDREGTQPAKYHSGLKKSTKATRDAQFKKGAEMSHKDPAAYPDKHAGDDTAKTRTSKHTKKYHDMFGEARKCTKEGGEAADFDMDPEDMAKRKSPPAPTYYQRGGVKTFKDLPRLKTFDENPPKGLIKAGYEVDGEYELSEDSKAALMKKADKSGIPYSILKKVYDRGMAAWRTGHRPGAGQEQWAYARVNSFITKGKGTWGGADKDLAAKVKSEAVGTEWSKGRADGEVKEACWDGYKQVGMKKKGGKTVPDCVPEAKNPAQQAAIAIAKKEKEEIKEAKKQKPFMVFSPSSYKSHQVLGKYKTKAEAEKAIKEFQPHMPKGHKPLEIRMNESVELEEGPLVMTRNNALKTLVRIADDQVNKMSDKQLKTFAQLLGKNIDRQATGKYVVEASVEDAKAKLSDYVLRTTGMGTTNAKGEKIVYTDKDNSDTKKEAVSKPRTLSRLLQQKKSSSLKYTPPTEAEKEADRKKDRKATTQYGAMKGGLKEDQQMDEIGLGVVTRYLAKRIGQSMTKKAGDVSKKPIETQIQNTANAKKRIDQAYGGKPQLVQSPAPQKPSGTVKSIQTTSSKRPMPASTRTPANEQAELGPEGKAKEIKEKSTKKTLKDVLPKSGAGQMGTDELVATYKNATPGQGDSLDENFSPIYTAKDLGIEAQGGFAHHPSVQEAMDELEENPLLGLAARGAAAGLSKLGKSKWWNKGRNQRIPDENSASWKTLAKDDISQMTKSDSAFKSGSNKLTDLRPMKAFSPDMVKTGPTPAIRQAVERPLKKVSNLMNGYCPETGELVESLIIEEAEYQGKKVKLNDPFRLPAGSKKKFGVYVKNDKGNVVKVTFGDPNMEIKRDDPKRRAAFRSRHSCDDDRGPKWKARYWSCYQWRAGKKVDN